VDAFTVNAMRDIFALAICSELTYMSIADLIHWRVEEQRLFPLFPKAAGATPRRAMFLSEELWNVLRSSYEDRDMETRMGHLLADLDHFVQSPSIDWKYLFHLYPARDGVWEIRSVRHDPSIRVLGHFADRDVFIATNHAFREDLGGWQSRQWKEVKRAARAKWNQLFHPYPPVLGTDVKALVSGALDGRYFRQRD
jgi:hypothetical protein